MVRDTIFTCLNAGWSQLSENVKKKFKLIFPCVEYTFFHADGVTVHTQLQFEVCFVNLHNADTSEKSDSSSINCQSLHEVSELPHLNHQKIWLTIASSAWDSLDKQDCKEMLHVFLGCRYKWWVFLKRTCSKMSKKKNYMLYGAFKEVKEYSG